MLAYNFVTGKASPKAWWLFLHGILGDRSNWRSIARALCSVRPDIGAVLVDLRAHGDSQGLSPPHTVARCADDLLEVNQAVRAETGLPITGVLGHSFGGKVALAFAARCEPPLSEVWIVDSAPGARPDRRGSEVVTTIVDVLGALPDRVESRESFIATLGNHGVTGDTAGWLAKNLKRDEDGRLALRVDLDAIGALLDDYFVADLWRVIEQAPSGTSVHLVVGERSEVVLAEDRARAQDLAAAHANVHLHVVERAGHWVHVDAPGRLISLLSGG